MKDALVFDTTNATSIADSDHVGSHTLSGSGDLITSGDGDSDNLVNTAIEGLDSRSFNYGYDASGDNWDRLQLVAGAMKVYIDDGDFEIDVVINAEKAEDSAHTTGDVGNYALGVMLSDIDGANSALLAGTNGDYQGFFTNAKGEMYTHDADVLAKLNAGVEVTATDLDIRNLVFATDKVDVTGSEVSLDAATLAALETVTVLQGTSPWVVSATDLDIRDLVHTQDSVRLGDGTSFYTSTTVGSDIGLDVYVLNDPTTANTAIANAVETLDVASTAQDIIASPLANRKSVSIYNSDNQKMYIGASGVTVANGFPLSPKSYMEFKAGASVDIEYVSTKVNHEIRTLELS